MVIVSFKKYAPGIYHTKIRFKNLTDDGTVEFDEFVIMCEEHEKEHDDPDEELIEAFRFFDKNNDNKISAKELRIAMQKLGDDPLDDDEVCYSY